MRFSSLFLTLALLTPLFASAQEDIFTSSADPAQPPLGTVDLLWQGEVYTPPFYLGRALWSGQSRLTVVAVPHVGSSAANSLVYRWTRDGEVLGNASGVGKRTLSFNDSVLSKATQIQLD